VQEKLKKRHIYIKYKMAGTIESKKWKKDWKDMKEREKERKEAIEILRRRHKGN
jgi:hypothetical protein